MRQSSGRPGRWLAAATLGSGVVGALLSTHPVELLAVGVMSVGAAVAITASPRPSDLLRARGVTQRWARIALVASALVGALGAFSGLGPSGLLLWLAALAAGWFLAGDTAPALEAATVAAAPDDAAGRAVPPRLPGSVGRMDGLDRGEERLAGLSDSELCWAWRNSYFAAKHAAADPDRLDRISRTRRGYLDEIQRRDPRGFASWLDAGARAASNPARYWKSDA